MGWIGWSAFQPQRMVSVLETEEDAKRRFMDGVNEDMDVVGVSEEDAAEG